MSLSSKSGQNSSAHYEANIGAKCVMFISLCKNANFELRYYFQKSRQFGGQFIFFCLYFTKTLRSSEWSNTIVKSFLFYFSIWNFFLFWRHKVKKNALTPKKDFYRTMHFLALHFNPLWAKKSQWCRRPSHPQQSTEVLRSTKRTN